MKIVISFLICLALTDGAAISNVKPGIVCDPPCVVTYDADISKVEVESEFQFRDSLNYYLRDGELLVIAHIEVSK